MDEKGDLYFIEVNARIQVEHPGDRGSDRNDLVKSQAIDRRRSAPLGHIETPVKFRGHAIECRINAENPDTFAPRPAGLQA